jgi:ribosome-binding protein aMBF1 (putative translation factor)
MAEKSELRYEPVQHDHEAFLGKARKRKGFSEKYEELEDEYNLITQMLSARAKAGLSQEAVAESMGTTKSAISRLESGGKHTPSLASLKKYAHAVGCRLEIKLVEERH